MVEPEFRILYVCVVNACRSVFAERLTRHALAARAAHGRWQVGSAGVEAVPGRPMHPLVRAVLSGRGVACDGFVSRRLTPALVDESDLVLAATAAVRDQAIAMLPAALRRTFTIKEFARLSRYAGPTSAGGQAAVAAAQAMRGQVPYVEPAEDDLPDPPPTPEAFAACAATLASVVEPVVDAVHPRRTSPLPA